MFRGCLCSNQIVELVWQLRGDVRKLQIGGAKITLAENGGGYIGQDITALVLTMLSK
jgi:hypothetical protein